MIKASFKNRRIMLIQYAGDFRAAYNQLCASGEEAYHGHRYVFSELERFRLTFGEVAIVCCLSPERYQETLPNGVTVIGAKAHPRYGFRHIRKIMAEWKPTDLIVLGALSDEIQWGMLNGCRVICQMADSFEINSIVRLLKFGRLTKTLNDPRVGWVTNHGANACEALIRLGVDASKVIAWDWPYSRHPEQNTIKEGPADGTLLYVGTVQPKKGVGDIITALARLRTDGRDIKLKVAGSGKIDEFRAMSSRLGVKDSVEFLGIISNNSVFELMKKSAMVIIPSRHDYPEGLPLTIYEALCARTPIVASDHAMFRGHLIDRETAMVFPARDSDALAGCIMTLLDDYSLYTKLSKNSVVVWNRLQNPVKWGDTLFRWLSDGVEDQTWLQSHRYSS